MNEPAARRKMTQEEYLAVERASEFKHEFMSGEAFARHGANRARSRIGVNLVAELGEALRDRDNEVYGSDMRVAATRAGSYFYPDASVTSVEPHFEDDRLDALVDPKVIVEILCDSAAANDRGTKFDHYELIDSVTDYVLVSQHSVRVEHFKRQDDGAWLLRLLGAGDELVLDSIGASVDVDRLHLKVTLTPEPPPPPER